MGERAAAYSWWNELVTGTKSSDPPSIPSIDSMSMIWPIVSPVMLAAISLKDSDNYWAKCRAIFAFMSKNRNIPSPEADFPGFVFMLWKNRRILKLTTVADAIRHIDQCCPETPNKFFLSTFIFAVANPVLSSEVFSRLQRDRHPKWLAFTSQDGAVERVFDLFLIFLTVRGDNTEASFWAFRKNMSDCLCSLLVEHCRTMVLIDYLSQTLFSRLCTLIGAAPVEYGLLFLRDAISVTRIALKLGNKETMRGQLSTLLSDTKESYLLHSLVVQWIRGFIGRCIQPKVFCKTIGVMPPTSTRELEMLAELANDHGGEVMDIVVRCFSRGMVQMKVWMRTYAQLLSDIICTWWNDETLQVWFPLFIQRAFMFMCMGLRRTRYTRRIFMLLTILSSNVFKGVDWVEECILTTAYSAYCAGFRHIGSFFLFRDDTMDDPQWREDYDIARSIKSNLKMFPFRARSCELLQIKDEDAAVKKEIQQQGLPPEIAALDISEKIKPLLEWDPELTHMQRQQIVFSLEDLADTQEEQLTSLDQKKELAGFPKVSSIMPSIRLEYRGYIAAYIAAEQVWATQSSHYNHKFYDLIKEVVRVVEDNNGITAKLDAIKAIVKTSNRNQEFRTVLKNKNRARDKINQLQKRNVPTNILMRVHDEANMQVVKMNMAFLYTKESDLEDCLGELIENNGTFHVDEKKIDAFMRANTVASLKAAISAITDSLESEVRHLNEQLCMVLHNAFVRLRFDRMYCVRHEMWAYKRADREFMRRATAFAARPVVELNLPQDMICREVYRMQIRKYFSTSKLVPVLSIAFMVNPLDMLWQLQLSVNSLIGFWSMRKLKNDEVRFSFLALLASNPPPNAFSLYKFLEKWDGLMLAPDLDKAKVHFMETVKMLLPLDQAPKES